MKVWVAKSGNQRALDITFDARPTIADAEDLRVDASAEFDSEEISPGLENQVFQPAQGLIYYLAGLAHRWRNLTLALPAVSPRTAFQELLSIPCSDAPNVARLEVSLEYDFYSSNFTENGTQMPTASYRRTANFLLRPTESSSLTLRIHPDVEIDEIPINWEVVTSLKLSTGQNHYQGLTRNFEAQEWIYTCLSFLGSSEIEGVCGDHAEVVDVGGWDGDYATPIALVYTADIINWIWQHDPRKHPFGQRS